MNHLLRIPYLTTVLENLESYFPMDTLTNIDLLDQRFWDENDIWHAHIQSKEKLKNLCKFFGLKFTELVFASWMKLLDEIQKENTLWCQTMESPPQKFWMGVIGKFTIEPTLLRIIQSSIVIPMGNYIIAHITTNVVIISYFQESTVNILEINKQGRQNK